MRHVGLRRPTVGLADDGHDPRSSFGDRLKVFYIRAKFLIFH